MMGLAGSMFNKSKHFAKNYFSDEQLSTWAMRGFSLKEVPLLFLTSPKITMINDEICRVEMPFRKVVKNHLGSLYFGALAIGADTCVGMLAFNKIKRSEKKISLVFKDFKADFLKRAVGRTTFVCEQGKEVEELIALVVETKERHHKTIKAHAEVDGEIVAQFELTLSLKYRG